MALSFDQIPAAGENTFRLEPEATVAEEKAPAHKPLVIKAVWNVKGTISLSTLTSGFTGSKVRQSAKLGS